MTAIPISSQEIRRANRRDVLRLLARNGPMMRSELCDQTGLTGAGLSRIVRELIESGLLVEAEPRPRKGMLGRRSAELAICPEGAYVLGLTIAANRKSVVLVDAGRQQIGCREFDDIRTDPEFVIETLTGEAAELIAASGIDRTRLVGVGVGVGALTSDDLCPNDLLSSSPLGWSNVPLRRRLEAALGLPVRIEARPSALLRAEIELTFGNGGALAKNRHVVLVNVGVGLGAARYVDGQVIWSGDDGIGSPAHIRVPGADVPCYCGRRGCLEHLGNGVAVISELQGDATQISLLNVTVQLDDAILRAGAGDRTAKRAFHKVGKRMAHGIDALQAMLGPDRIILSGATGRQPDYVSGLREGLAQMSSMDAMNQLEVSKARSATASASVGLDAFVFSRDLDLQKLAAA